MAILPDWSFTDLESLIESRGDDVIHERAVACPCRAEDTFGSMIEIDGRQARRRSMGCEQCDGNGWLWRDARVIHGLVTSVNPGNRTLIDAGRSEPGDCVFSPSLNEAIISDFDKITFLYAVPLDDGQQIIRNAANMQDNKRLNLGIAENEDKLWYFPATAIWCEDENGVVYTQNADFIFNQKKITWIGNKPANGVLYTIKYTAYIEWVCYTSPMTRIDNARNLGQRVGLKRVHVVFPNDVNDTPGSRQEEELTFNSRSKL